jgi:hypothetical protein
MAIAAPQIASLIALTLPSTPDSARKARFYTRAALSYHELGDYAEDAETVTSELVTNAITHAGATTFGLEIMHLKASGRWLSSSPIPQHGRRSSDTRQVRPSMDAACTSSMPYRLLGDGGIGIPARPCTPP